MLVTPSGIAMLVKLLHLENALCPMLVKLLGNTMFIKLLQPVNAS